MSYKGNTVLLIWVGLLSGYVVAKAGASRTVQTDAKKYEEHPPHKAMRPHDIKAGDRVWLALNRVKEGYSKNLAHTWHGLFMVAEMVDQHAAGLETAATGYRLFPIINVTKLKLVTTYPGRPITPLTIDMVDRVDFDEGLLPED
ncbi:hypothetical protein PInf_003371 [Phytophthora infestans]|nr:hypothetical protein PInf_003371 [Phytophthora infestans]